MLSRFADQAALSLEVAELVELLRAAPEQRRRSAEHLLAALGELLAPEPDELER